jgi:hypothetical protein
MNPVRSISAIEKHPYSASGEHGFTGKLSSFILPHYRTPKRFRFGWKCFSRESRRQRKCDPARSMRCVRQPWGAFFSSSNASGNKLLKKRWKSPPMRDRGFANPMRRRL